MTASVYRRVNRRCVSLYALYGAPNKDQRRNYQRVPVGSVGVVTYEVTEGFDGSKTYVAKFVVDGRMLHVRCAVAMIAVTGESPAPERP